MKRIVMIFTLLILAFAGFGQEAVPVESVPWYGTTEFWITIAGAGLIVIEWIIRVVPTSKPVGFLLSALVSILKWIINRVPQKVKKQ